MRVAVLMSSRFSYSRDVAWAVGQAARAFPDVRLRLYGSTNWEIELATRWKPQGIIVGLASPQLVETLTGWRLPVVGCTMGVRLPTVPQVIVDNVAVGRTQARHLVDRGYRRLLFVDNSAMYSELRRTGFLAQAQEMGVESASTLLHRSHHQRRWSEDRVRRFLKKTILAAPKPLGVGCATDHLGLWLSQTCQDVGLQVPEDIGIVGVDDDQLICLFADPPLSSVRQPTEAIGATALNLVRRIVLGEAVDTAPKLLPPLPVAERESTSLRATSDDLVRQALELMGQFLHEPINVEKILDRLDVSRAWLEKRFRQAIGRTPYQEILRLRMERAQQLLIETQWKVEDVASQCGFTGRGQFSAAFRREVGCSPSEYRAQRSAPAPGAPRR